MATASAKFIVNLAKKLPPICIYNYILTLKMKKKTTLHYASNHKKSNIIGGNKMLQM